MKQDDKAIKNKRAVLATSVALALSTLALSAAAQTSPKLGLGLRELAAQQQSLSAVNGRTAALAGKQALRAGDAMMFDAQERVRVKVTLDGQQPLPAVLAATEGLGSRVLASSDKYRKGVLTAYVPISSLNSLAETSGVRSVVLALGLETNVGATTSQGAPAMRTDQVNAQGITGAGITVGVMSDSYNTSANAIKAANDVASGDLPGTGNPLGNSQNVVVVWTSPAAATKAGPWLRSFTIWPPPPSSVSPRPTTPRWTSPTISAPWPTSLAPAKLM